MDINRVASSLALIGKQLFCYFLTVSAKCSQGGVGCNFFLTTNSGINWSIFEIFSSVIPDLEISGRAIDLCSHIFWSGSIVANVVRHMLAVGERQTTPRSRLPPLMLARPAVDNVARASPLPLPFPPKRIDFPPPPGPASTLSSCAAFIETSPTARQISISPCELLSCSALLRSTKAPSHTGEAKSSPMGELPEQVQRRYGLQGDWEMRNRYRDQIRTGRTWLLIWGKLSKTLWYIWLPTL